MYSHTHTGNDKNPITFWHERYIWNTSIGLDSENKRRPILYMCVRCSVSACAYVLNITRTAYNQADSHGNVVCTAKHIHGCKIADWTDQNWLKSTHITCFGGVFSRRWCCCCCCYCYCFWIESCGEFDSLAFPFAHMFV